MIKTLEVYKWRKNLEVLERKIAAGNQDGPAIRQIALAMMQNVESAWRFQMTGIISLVGKIQGRPTDEKLEAAAAEAKSEFAHDLLKHFTLLSPDDLNLHAVSEEIFGARMNPANGFNADKYLCDEVCGFLTAAMAESSQDSSLPESVRRVCARCVEVGPFSTSDFPLVVWWRNQIMAENTLKVFDRIATNDIYLFVGKTHRRGVVAELLRARPEFTVVRHDLTSAIALQRQCLSELVAAREAGEDHPRAVELADLSQEIELLQREHMPLAQ
jgi:hypothetical protein